ncbi:MAG: hypothetical protein ACI4D3_01775 [Lachnospiraceae bacterium]
MKKYIFLFPVLFFTVFFAVGGLLLPGFLMDRQQRSLSEKTETMILPVISDFPDSRGFRKFSTEKLLQVASSYSFESSGMDYWLTYMPEEGQLTTAELLQVAHQQIDRFCELEILPEQFSSENYTYEGLEHGIPWSADKEETDGSDIQNSDYSGWVVSGGNSGLSVTACVNSVSGQILYLNASWNYTDSSSRPKAKSDILKRYLKYLELDQEPVSLQEGEEYTACVFDRYDNYILNIMLFSSTSLIPEEDDPEHEAEISGHCSLSISILNRNAGFETESKIESP